MIDVLLLVCNYIDRMIVDETERGGVYNLISVFILINILRN